MDNPNLRVSAVMLAPSLLSGLTYIPAGSGSNSSKVWKYNISLAFATPIRVYLGTFHYDC